MSASLADGADAGRTADKARGDKASASSACASPASLSDTSARNAGAQNAGAKDTTTQDQDDDPATDGGDQGLHRWKRVQSRLRAELGEDVYSSWFSSAMLEQTSGGQVVLSVATRFLKHWIENNFGARLLALWQLEDAGVERIALLVRTGTARRIAKLGEDAKGAMATPANTNQSTTAAGTGGNQGARAGHKAGHMTGGKAPARHDLGRQPVSGDMVRKTDMTRKSVDSRAGTARTERQGASSDAVGTPLDPRYTFQTFAVGQSNQFAFRAARELARDGSVLGCKVLFLRGGVGLGKTHLCQAIAAQLQAGAKRTLYLTAEKFMRDFVLSLRARSTVDYKEALAAIDVLVVDDVQFLSGQTIQGEFCHIINTLIDAGKTLVVAADRAPAALDTIDTRMQSRLSSGLVVEIGAMDRTVRKAILERRRAAYQAEGGQAEVSDAVLDKVADLITTNGRDLEGAFNRIIAEIGLNNAPVSEQTVASCIGFLLSNAEQPRVKIEDIQRATALQFGLTKTDLLSKRRTKQIVGPRQIAMYLSKIMTVRSLPDIGRRFGGRDHTTVLHAVRKIEKELQTDTDLQKTIETLKSAILSQG